MDREQYFKKVIEMELRRLNANASGPQKKTEQDIEFLVSDWFDEFKNITKETLVSAIKDHKSKSVFFPTIADIRQKVDAIQARKSNDPKALPMPNGISKEQKELNLKMIKKIKAGRLTKKLK